MSWVDLQRLHPWPDECPDIKPTRDGWTVHETAWYEIFGDLEQPIFAEVGSWMGRTSHWLMQRFPRLRLIAVDLWTLDADNFVRTHRDHWVEMGRIKATDALADIYRVNLWDYRERVVTIQSDSVDGMRRIAGAAVQPAVVYIDASHDYPAVIRDVTTALELFPRSVICGDDYKRGGPVATAVHDIADARGYSVRLYGNTRFWRYD